MMTFKYALNLIFVFLFFVPTGCSPVRYFEEHKTIDITKSPQREVVVRVLAEAQDWLNSGAVVHTGRQYEIKARGKWHGGPICGWTGPDGIGAAKMCFFNIIPGWSISTLIAKIGDEGQPFAIADEFTFVASKDGVLLFRINEPASSCADNQGFVTVKIASPRVTHDIIDVRIIGFDNGIKTTRHEDFREAVLNAKAQAIERAGVEIKTVSEVKNFKLREDHIETRAQAILMPNFEIIDIGYTESGTYTVMLIGKIKITDTSHR
ncbi:MAG: hypothetical protein R6W75_03875 [Smithellaceae bacterium]